MSRRTLAREAAFFGIPMLIAALVTAVIAPPYLAYVASLRDPTLWVWSDTTGYAEDDYLSWVTTHDVDLREPTRMQLYIHSYAASLRGPMPLIVRLESIDSWIRPVAFRFEGQAIDGVLLRAVAESSSPVDAETIRRVMESLRITTVHAHGRQRTVALRTGHPLEANGQLAPFLSTYLLWWWDGYLRELTLPPVAPYLRP